MKDAYSFHTTEESLDEGYDRIVDAYKNIFARCGLDIALVEADSGAIGGKDSQEFMVLTDTGEDELIFCNNCNYAANQEKATSIKPPVTSSENLPIEEVSTPNITSITNLTEFLGIRPDRTIKAVMYAADNELIFVSIRGDLEVNEVKLKNWLKVADLRIATEQEVATSGIVAGFASAVGLTKIRHIADDSIKIGGNFVAGANKQDTHLKNVNYPRDFDVDEIIDIATAEEGHQCTNCNGELTIRRGIEAGHVFKVGQGYSETFNSTFLDNDGAEKPTIMGCYGIGVGRILGAAIEQHHDDRGIVFPPSIAPYQIHLVGLNMENENVHSTANKIYDDLQSSGYEVIYDDREESAGVKFNDADLLGFPIRVTVSPRTLKQNAVEIKERTEERKDAQTVPLDDMMPMVEQVVNRWH
jgi:prolyl-tRNA synthetase